MFDHRFTEQVASQHAADLRAAAERRRRAKPSLAPVRTVGRRHRALRADRRRAPAVSPELQDC